MAETILIVEDHKYEAQLLEEMLRQVGAANPIHIVPSAIEAIAYLEGHYPYSDRSRFPLPKILLLDLKMPGMDGFEFMNWLQAHKMMDLLKVIVVSGLDDMAAIRQAYRAGARSFLPKPYTQSDLENLMQAHPCYWALPEQPPQSTNPGASH